MFENARFSIQNNLFFAGTKHRTIKIIPKISGIIYIPVTMLHVKDKITATAVKVMWAILSDPKYLGFNPTIPRDTEDKNGRN